MKENVSSSISLESQEEKSNSGKRERKITIPLLKVEEVIVLGEITLTTPALACLLESRVPITYLTRYGHYLGSLSPHLTKNSVLRLAQHASHVASEKRHAVAQQFVIGKLRNMRILLQRYHRAHPDQQLQEQIETIKRCIASALQTGPHQEQGEQDESAYLAEMDVEEMATNRMNGLGPLLGCEGAGSAAYFHTFAHLIKCKWEHGFTRRVRRPPTDPVNALLSYGYVILAAQVSSAVTLVGFDPYIGYLHASCYGKPALALDLMEEFRPLLVNSVVLSLFNNHQLEAKDFVTEFSACRMTDATKRLFLQKFEERMQETIKHPVFGYTVSYRRCIELQARLLGKYLIGEIEQYTSFTVR